MTQDAGKIVGAGHHLLSLINQVIDFARIDAGKAELVPAIFDIASWARELRDLVVPLAARNGNSLLLPARTASALRSPIRCVCGNAC